MRDRQKDTLRGCVSDAVALTAVVSALSAAPAVAIAEDEAAESSGSGVVSAIQGSSSALVDVAADGSMMADGTAGAAASESDVHGAFPDAVPAEPQS